MCMQLWKRRTVIEYVLEYWTKHFLQPGDHLSDIYPLLSIAKEKHQTAGYLHALPHLATTSPARYATIRT
jgi:hypothetical protein